MTREHWQIVAVFVLNTLVVLLYLLIQFFRKKEKKRGYLLKGLVMFLCPVAGPLFFIGSQLFYWMFFRVEADLSDVVFSKEKKRQRIRANEDEGLEMASLEEALEISDTDSVRRLMLNVVRGDMRKSLSAISMALNSRDTETSHYAASVLQEELNSFRSTVQNTLLEIQLELKKEEDGDPCEMCTMLLSYMNQVLSQKVFTDMEQISYVNKMENVAEILYEHGKEKMLGKNYEDICLRLLDIKEYELCEKWCLRGKEHYPNTLSSYTCMLKLYFSSGQKEKFFQVLDELKKSQVVVDKETLELIRTFS